MGACEIVASRLSCFTCRKPGHKVKACMDQGYIYFNYGESGYIHLNFPKVKAQTQYFLAGFDQGSSVDDKKCHGSEVKGWAF